MNNGVTITPYSADRAAEWDDFIDNYSINGTFLQCRRFLNYHGERFKDCSLMFYRKDKLACVCPACEIMADSGKDFSSNKGSTFGGLIFSGKEYTSSHVLEIIQTLKVNRTPCQVQIINDSYATL
ncbi:MAG: hypothetical protein LBS62_14700 [Clostridiales bacterium]|nr:hypothetical protein [Clostridiales bacterium]